MGYLGDPVRTSEAIDHQGWLHTGDIGHFDEVALENVVCSVCNYEGTFRSIQYVTLECCLATVNSFFTCLSHVYYLFIQNGFLHVTGRTCGTYLSIVLTPIIPNVQYA